MRSDTATFTVASKTGSLYIRSWLVGWAGSWNNNNAGTDPGIVITNNAVSGTTYTITVTGYSQKLTGITVGYIIASLSGTFLTYERIFDDTFDTTTLSSGSSSTTTAPNTMSPNFVGSVMAGLYGFRFKRNANWGIQSTITLTGTTSTAETWIQTGNSSATGVVM